MTAIPQGRRTRRATLTSALCALVVVTGTGLTGCSGDDPDAGTNGVGKLPADQVQARTKAAAASAGAVHLAGDVVSNGRTYRLDMRLKSDGGTGSVTSQGVTFGLLRVGAQLYLKADAQFWSNADNDDRGAKDGKDAAGGTNGGAAGKLDGKYVKVPQRDPAYKRFSGFTDKGVLLDSLLTLHGALAADGRHEQSGVRTLRITGGDGSGGTLDVSLEGAPYPLRLERAGDAGTLTFTEWGKDFPLAEPDADDTVDYGKQLPTS
ncbi:hypothetical protein ACH4C2_13655 [Streptomyces sp. NPDC018057]|uniref:hypothetical protein n=1 Tax=unclassified Streptomyces TaxID=2593676 RepID=UPI0037BBFDB4